jgi:hypothetical protein
MLVLNSSRDGQTSSSRSQEFHPTYNRPRQQAMST